MNARLWIRALAWLLLGVVALGARLALAGEAPPVKNWSLSDDTAVRARPDDSLVDVLARDLHLSLWTGSEESTLKLSLAPGEWSLLKDVQPYAAFSPSGFRSLTDATLSTSTREAADDPWKGLGVGAGLKLRLSDRVDFFGQYLFMSLPGSNAPTGSPLMRREVESPGLKGGLSIHF